MHKTLAQINTVVDRGATGRIVQMLDAMAVDAGWTSHVYYGRGDGAGLARAERFSSVAGVYVHALATRLADRHGLHSQGATRRLVERLESVHPDVVHLHNLHGYYLNYPILTSWLRRTDAKVVWTIHDLWPLTGHCAYFEPSGCDRWRSGCHHCPDRRSYPSSWIADRSALNHADRRRAFADIPNLTLVAVSGWLRDRLKESYLSAYPIEVVYHGVDLEHFRPVESKASERKRLLGVANVWDARKGLDDFKALRSLLPDSYEIVLVGLTPKQIRELPEGIEGFTHTSDTSRLAWLYSQADVFVNPTRGDTLSMTNIEAQACGTPVVSYGAGGAPEGVAPGSGRVVPVGDVAGLAEAVKEVASDADAGLRSRKWVEENFDSRTTFKRYLEIYDK